MDVWTEVPVNKRGDPWFNDGNIVLFASADTSIPETVVAFKVHRGVVARHSEVFENMFDMPPPVGEPMEMVEGCPVVHMIGDRPNEVGHFIKALYDGVSFQHKSMDDFFYVAGILRLATKYFVRRLREQAIRHLLETWSHTLQGHDAMVERALSSPTIDGATFPYVHPLHVLNLARETNVTVIVPSVLYFLSIYSLADIIRADHPKLVVSHPSVPSTTLEYDALRDYSLMHQRRLSMMLFFIQSICGSREEAPKCSGAPRQCLRGFSRLTYQVSSAMSVRTGVFHNMAQAAIWLDEDNSVCSACKKSFRRDIATQREQWWKELPSVVGLPDWDVLAARDLPSS